MDTTVLSHVELFRDIQIKELQLLLPCLQAREKRYAKGEMICRAGETISELGVVVSGSINVMVNFYWGGSNIFGHFEAGQVFGETYAALPERELLVDVVAAEDCMILFLNLNKLLTTCRRSCVWHHQIIRNLIRLSAEKNLSLSTRMMQTAPKTIRERLSLYLSEQAQHHGRNHFTIPYSRQQLADYLSVDRSALSNELSKMQQDGLIRFHRSEFTLLKELDM
ncbi:Crp/Fnr family transcriptional regulator [Hornefia butyriciproducens]|uniref:Crp/Fnr family transcriptional regulator n=1 Tax=Hornefia butyriciproducens TaxID=2652293 RepID=UPI003F8C4A30